MSTALITGASQGLGLALTNAFAARGWNLVVDARDGTRLREATRTLPTVVAIAGDVTDPGHREALAAAAEVFGPLDLLVNNAAANFIARTDKLSARAVDAVLDIVLHGSFYCTIAAGRRWIEANRPGNVISTVSTPTITGSAFTVPSAAAKAGVLAMTRSLAVEWGPKGIRLNCVAPGLFPTEGAWERLYPPGSQVEPQERGVPLRRFGNHQELCDLYAYLAADGSGYVTGDLIVIDGGRWMQGAGGPTFRAMQDWDDDQWNAMRKR